LRGLGEPTASSSRKNEWSDKLDNYSADAAEMLEESAGVEMVEESVEEAEGKYAATDTEAYGVSQVQEADANFSHCACQGMYTSDVIITCVVCTKEFHARCLGYSGEELLDIIDENMQHYKCKDCIFFRCNDDDDSEVESEDERSVNGDATESNGTKIKDYGGDNTGSKASSDDSSDTNGNDMK
jgi:hypothetical protein